MEAGQLVRVLPRYSERAATLYLLYPRTQHVPRKVTALANFGEICSSVSTSPSRIGLARPAVSSGNSST